MGLRVADCSWVLVFLRQNTAYQVELSVDAKLACPSAAFESRLGLAGVFGQPACRVVVHSWLKEANMRTKMAKDAKNPRRGLARKSLRNGILLSLDFYSRWCFVR
jgi:hypothetical protein